MLKYILETAGVHHGSHREKHSFVTQKTEITKIIAKSKTLQETAQFRPGTETLEL